MEWRRPKSAPPRRNLVHAFPVLRDIKAFHFFFRRDAQAQRGADEHQDAERHDRAVETCVSKAKKLRVDLVRVTIDQTLAQTVDARFR